AIQGFPGTMRNGAGALAGRVDWTGSPLAIDYSSLQGHLSLVLGKGEFLKTEPGIAKLIGVLNLQSLRQRLAFDFRDLFAEGFAFTDVRGMAKVANGIAHTDDFEMRGVTAQVKIKGDANLVAETQDLLVEVRPELNAGLASLAYAALANPAIGLASFAAQLLLRQPLQQLFAWTYEVTGSWSDPQVTTKSRPTVEAPPPPSGG
ncbi:MAG: AsmA-like C-terminal region-containing protein, partial [Gammaproteobacteria bacterium]